MSPQQDRTPVTATGASQRDGESPWSRLRAVAGANSQTSFLVVLVVTIGIVFTIINPAVYATALNFQSIAYAVPEIGLLALAVSIVMNTGGIDLSVVSTANLSAITLASVAGSDVVPSPLRVPAALLAGLAVALVCGTFNGLLVTKVSIAPILATLATMQLYRGVAILVTKGRPLSGLPNGLVEFGELTLVIVPASFWIFLIVAGLLWFLVSRTGFGLRVTLIGANPVAARYSGIARDLVLLRTYILTGGVAGVAGFMMVAHSAYASAGYGPSYLLLAITIAVLGGANPYGGRGPVIGVVLAAVALQMTSSGFNMLSISPYLFAVTQGLTLVVVLIVEGRTGALRKWLGR